MEIQQLQTSENASKLTNNTRILGKNDFLKMLVTQLRFQDPLNPMNDTQFIAQLAQFSSLEQLQNLNSSFESNMLLNQSLHNSMAVNMIGKNIKAYGSTVYLEKGDPAKLVFDLQEAAQVTIRIKDSSGKLVREIKAGRLSSGLQEISWDGKDDNGKELDSGKYTFLLEAKDSGGQDVPVVSYTYGRVTGVKYEDGSAILMIGDIPVKLGEVVEVLE